MAMLVHSKPVFEKLRSAAFYSRKWSLAQLRGRGGGKQIFLYLPLEVGCRCLIRLLLVLIAIARIFQCGFGRIFAFFVFKS